MVSGDRDQTGFAKTMKNAHFNAVPFDPTLIAAIRAKHTVDHWPHPVILNGKTGEVIERNAWGKTDVNSLKAMIANA